MKRKLFKLSRHYQDALLTHLKLGNKASIELARGLGRDALAAGLQTLDLAKLHEQILVAEVLPGCQEAQRKDVIKRAGVFFTAAIFPIETTHHCAQEAAAQLKDFVEALSRRTVELAASNRELSLEIAQRKVAEQALKDSKFHYAQLLDKSNRMQEEFQQLTRKILSAQEDERKSISRELHDVIAQTLTSINIRLATLKKDATLNTRNLERNIALTQRLVKKSVEIVHRFARELRPAVLDDLGLIAALHAFMENFTRETGVRTRLTAFAGLDRLDQSQRTVMYRVAQEALTNVARHAKASRVDVCLQKMADCIRMEVKDNGKSFKVESAMKLKGGSHLGIIGMRERMEMIGGRFSIQSAPGEGSTVVAEIPMKSILRATAKKTLVSSQSQPISTP
jgi:signal transduction histidine kinase